MPGVRPLRLLVKVPEPVPSVVCEPVTKGPVVVPQQTPLAVTALVPMSVTLPPLAAVVEVIEVAAVVAARVGYPVVQVPQVILDGQGNVISPGIFIYKDVYKEGTVVEDIVIVIVLPPLLRTPVPLSSA